MESFDQPHRCPKCQALVVDRRSPVCTTCRAALPTEWVMTPQQVARVNAIDREIRAEHAEAMQVLNNPQTNPNVPAFVKLLDMNVDG